ncbi:hypothetical protein [Levilactobacillus cerevisiae]|uniref:hypothetical protein n=1 Tax=Levilactobacillus cerevisiae TaxID=1704076 RepID=UPI000F7A79BD|nr:hypothetical protein [Levilactobacillus cerevisiae]
MKTTDDNEFGLLIDEPEARPLTSEERRRMLARESTPAYKKWLKAKEAEADRLFNLPPTKH